MQIDKETVNELTNGHTTVGTTKAKLVDLELNAYKGILLRCPGSADPGGGNSDPVWVGGAGVTADSAATGGMPILPGSSMFVPLERANLLYVISTAADQDIAWMVI